VFVLKLDTLKVLSVTNELQERFQKMTALDGEQIEKSQYVERFLGKLLSSIALLLTGKISPLLISLLVIKLYEIVGLMI
jgi:hypothetical protein